MAHFTQITTFIAVVEQNSFAGAARQQGVSVAAISRQVARLEAELQVQLLHRTTRRLTLTEIGAQYYQQCKRTLAELAKRRAPSPPVSRKQPGHYLLPATGILPYNIYCRDYRNLWRKIWHWKLKLNWRNDFQIYKKKILT